MKAILWFAAAEFCVRRPFALCMPHAQTEVQQQHTSPGAAPTPARRANEDNTGRGRGGASGSWMPDVATAIGLLSGGLASGYVMGRQRTIKPFLDKLVQDLHESGVDPSRQKYLIEGEIANNLAEQHNQAKRLLRAWFDDYPEMRHCVLFEGLKINRQRRPVRKVSPGFLNELVYACATRDPDKPVPTDRLVTFPDGYPVYLGALDDGPPPGAAAADVTTNGKEQAQAQAKISVAAATAVVVPHKRNTADSAVLRPDKTLFAAAAAAAQPREWWRTATNALVRASPTLCGACARGAPLRLPLSRKTGKV